MSERHDLTTITAMAKFATIGFVAFQVLFSGFLLWQNFAFRAYLANQTGAAELAAIDRADSLVMPISVAFIVAVIVIYIINGRWIFLASRNAGIMAPSAERITPGWAVGWFVVPFANFFMPYRAMKETWAASVGVSHGTGSVMPSWFIIWWLSWVAMNLSDRVITQLGSSPNQTPEQFLAWNNYSAFSGLFWAIPAYFFLRIIKNVSAAQHGYREVFA